MARTHYEEEVLIHSPPVAHDKSGVLVSVTREQANWKTINFSVRRLIAGQYWQSNTRDQEAALVVLGGKATMDWGEGPREIGDRKDVFSGYPYAIYLPSHTFFEISAITNVRICGLPHSCLPLSLVLASSLPQIAARRFAAEEIAPVKSLMSFARSFLLISS